MLIPLCTPHSPTHFFLGQLYCFGSSATYPFTHFPDNIGRGSAVEHVLYFKCHRKYYNGSATENTDLDIFCDTCLQWEFHYSIF